MTRRARRGILAAVALALALVGLFAGPAAAHAVVVSSNPADGQVLAEAPRQATIQFSERISADNGGLSVLDSQGRQVDNGDSSTGPTGDTLTVTLPSGLADGTYVMNYRVVSADGHPVSGAIVFGVGTGTVIDRAGASAVAVVADRPYEIAAGVARFVTYASALLAAGLAIFLTFIHDQDADRWRLTPVVRISSVVAGLGALAIIAMQAALTTGRGVDAMTDVTTLRRALAEGLGWQSVVLLAGLAVVHLSTDTNKLLLAQIMSFYGGLAVAGSFVLWGHAREAPNPVLAVSADALHVITAAVWFGGLVGLGATLRRRFRSRADADPVSSAAMVARFSTVAAGCLIALLGAGALLAWQEVGSRDAFTSTTYGRVLLVKILVVLGLVLVAAYNRFTLVPDIEAMVASDTALDDTALDDTALDASVGLAANEGTGVSSGAGNEADPEAATEPVASSTTTTATTTADTPDDTDRHIWRRLSTTVRAEALIILVVLALTSALVNVAPARTAAGGKPVVFNQTQPAGQYLVNLVVAPGSVGTNALHIQYLDATGRPVDTPRTLQVELALPDQNVGPIRMDVARAGPGHFITDEAQFPIAGRWDVTLIARISDFEDQRTTFSVKIVG